jgi:hypothetical protein
MRVADEYPASGISQTSHDGLGQLTLPVFLSLLIHQAHFAEKLPEECID